MELTKTPHRTYAREYKVEAINLATRNGLSVAQVARGLAINEKMLYNWRRKFRDDPQCAFPGKGWMKPPEEENHRLRRENAILKEEQDFLKKAAVWLTREAH